MTRSRHSHLQALLATAFLAAPAISQCEVQSLVSSDSAPDDRFGTGVALDGARAVLGSASELDISFGAAYVFERVGSQWVEVQKLLPADAGPPRSFGAAAALDGDRLVVGMPFDSAQAPYAGSAYVFERIAGTWTQVAKLVASAPQASARFGKELELQGDRIVVGAPNFAGGPLSRGRVHVFDLTGGVWNESAVLQDVPGPVGDYFGDGLALDGDTILVGSPLLSTSAGILSGQAFVYELVGGTWTETQRILPADLANYDRLGSAIALDGDRAFIGARGDSTATNASSGAVYVFERAGGSFALAAKLYPQSPLNWYQFGLSVALEGDTALVGSAADEVHFLKREADVWVTKALLRSEPDPAAVVDTYFGWKLDLSGATAMIGEPVLAPSPAPGSVEVFDFPSFVSNYCTCADAGHCPDPFAGCANSSGSGGALRACGSNRVSTDDLLIQAWKVPTNKPILLLMGGAQALSTFGDGQLCVGSSGSGLFRFAIQDTGPFGHAVVGPGLVAYSQIHFGLAGTIQAGSTWNFQCWFRDDPTTVCGGMQMVPSGFNLTDALTVTFAP